MIQCNSSLAFGYSGEVVICDFSWTFPRGPLFQKTACGTYEKIYKHRAMPNICFDFFVRLVEWGFSSYNC